MTARTASIQASQAKSELARKERHFNEVHRMLTDEISESAKQLYQALPSQYDAQKTRGKKRTYTMMSEIGKGSYGTVHQAKIQEGVKKEKIVALKLTGEGDKEAIKSAIHESEILKQLKDAPHGSRLIEASLIKHGSLFSHQIAMDFEQGTCLHKLSFPKSLTMRDLKALTQGLLEQLVLLNSMGKVHADLKPGNIVYNPKSQIVKLVDYGNCHRPGDDYSTYVQTQGYRAPEVILGKPFDGRIDVWSLGCTLCKVLLNAEFFSPPGKDGSLETSRAHIEMIVEVIGLPSYEYLKDCKFAEAFFKIDHKNGKVLGLQGSPRNHGMREKIKNPSDPVLRDLISKMLSWNRPSAEEMLKHPFFHDEISFKLEAHVPPDREIAFEFALPSQEPFMKVDASETTTCVHVPLTPSLLVTPVDKATGEKGTTLAVNAEKDDSIIFNVTEDL